MRKPFKRQHISPPICTYATSQRKNSPPDLLPMKLLVGFQLQRYWKWCFKRILMLRSDWRQESSGCEDLSQNWAAVTLVSTLTTVYIHKMRQIHLTSRDKLSCKNWLSRQNQRVVINGLTSPVSCKKFNNLRVNAEIHSVEHLIQ